MQRFALKLVCSAVILALGGLPSSFVYAGADCTPTYSPSMGQTVTCSPSAAAIPSGVQSSDNNVVVNIDSGAELRINGSPIGLGASSTVTNSGALNSATFYYGYGISFGVNGRSDAGGNSVTNTASGVIQTGGTNASGIYVNASNTTASPNTIVNAGSIATTGGGTSYGIKLINRANTDSITNTGSISSASTDGISVTGAANITNSGSVSGAVNAVNFNNTTANTNANTLTLQAGSVISGAVAFSTTKTSETLAFDGLSNSNFNNTVTGANIIKAINGAAITMNSTAGYSLGSGQVNVDGSSALTIAGVLQDGAIATSLNKTGAGTLTLTGANTYTGNTLVSAGTIRAGATNTFSPSSAFTVNAGAILDLNGYNQRIASLAGAGNTTLGAGTLTTGANNTSTTYSGVMSGTGGLVKEGSGVFTLSGTNTYTGDTTVSAGTLNLTGSVASNTLITAGATLEGNGTINGSLTNAGNVQPASGTAKTNLTITGNYVGQGGTFTTHTYGPSNAVTADTLTIDGQATGSTTIAVRDSGALGQPTTGNWILLVNSPNSTSTTAFQTGRIAAGAYEYKLVQTNGSWYLKTSDNAVPSAPPTEPDPPGEPVTPQAGQRIETALYPALPTLARMYALNVVDSYDQRRGDLALLSDGGTNRKSGTAWGRLMGKIAQSDPSSATFGPMLKSRTYGVQVGLDFVNQETSDGGLTFIGPFATFGQATGRVSSQSGAVQTGSVSLNAYSGGINATHITKEGHYVDALVQGTYFENATANSLVSTAISTQGGGLTASVEGGYKMAVTTRMSFIPQLQVIYNLNSLKNSADTYSAVSMPNDSATLGRVGFKLSHNGASAGPQASNVWARVSGLSMLSGANTQTTFSNLVGTNTTTLNTQAPTSWMAFDIGANKVISGNHLVYLNAGYESALSTMYQAGYVKGGYTYRF